MIFLKLGGATRNTGNNSPSGENMHLHVSPNT